jgi:hypothetical protein
METQHFANIMIGSGMGGMLSGFISLAQQPSEGVETFNPRVFFSIFTFLLILPIVSLHRVLTKKIGFKSENVECPPTSKRTSSTSVNSVAAVSKHEEDKHVSSPLLLNAKKDDVYCDVGDSKDQERTKNALSGVGSSAPSGFQRRTSAWLIYALAIPTTVETWAFAPSFLPYAAAAIGGTCDEENTRTVQGEAKLLSIYVSCIIPQLRHCFYGHFFSSVLRYTLSFSNLAIFFGAMGGLVLPSHSIKNLTILTAIIHLAFVIEMFAVNESFLVFWTSDFGAIVLVLCHVAIRFMDTYVTTCFFMLVADREETDREKEKATENFGLALTIGTAIASFLAFMLVGSKYISPRFLLLRSASNILLLEGRI